MARRLAAPVKDVADATSQLAEGHLHVRVADPQMGPEFATLTASVNQLAHRLQTTDATRRQLTSDLAHQLRTPIASLEATLEAVREGVLPVDDSTLETLTAQSGRLRRLVADLEQVSRAEERQLLLRPQPTRVSDLVDAAIAAHRDRYRAADVRLTSAINADTPLVTVDPDRIQEVLANLLDNALRHTPQGGDVIVSCNSHPLPGGPAAVITVRDNGQGFAPDDAGLLFQRFHKGSASTGSGLGLTIARAITQAHHGTLTAHSAGIGQGAEFTLVLPASPSAGT